MGEVKFTGENAQGSYGNHPDLAGARRLSKPHGRIRGGNGSERRRGEMTFFLKAH